MEHAFTWVSIIPGLNLLQTHTATASLVIAGLLVWALVGLRQIQAATDAVIPDATLTARNSLEIFVEWFVGFIEGLLGHKGRTFVHVYGTFFLFILAANLTGLLPGFVPPTSDFNITFALGAFVSLIQAFVFTILSIIYLSLALADHEHHEEAHAEH